jgi:hypothetical protein
MIIYKCPECGREHICDKKRVLIICSSCLVEMKEWIDGGKKNV